MPDSEYVFTVTDGNIEAVKDEGDYVPLHPEQAAQLQLLINQMTIVYD